MNYLSSRLLGIMALTLALLISAESRASALPSGGPGDCDKGCLEVTDPGGEPVGNACIDGQGGAVDCYATTSYCGEISCRVFLVFSEDGLPAALVSPCEDDNAATVIADLSISGTTSGLALATDEALP
jgi:hypothetical protein